jgi:hypothetical protein
MLLLMALTFIRPQLPTLVETPPDGTEWIHEIKYDGYRTQLIIEMALFASSPAMGTTGRRATRRSPERRLSSASAKRS